MKKFLALALSLCLVLSLAACGGKKADDTADNDNTASDTTFPWQPAAESRRMMTLPKVPRPAAPYRWA